MPANKNLIARIRVINECLRDRAKRYWSKEDLIQRILDTTDIRTSERSFMKDIEEMRHSTQLNYFAPIEYSKKWKGYYYSDPDYSIDRLPLNDSDIKALELAATTLNQYKNVPFFNGFTSTIDKVISLVNQVKKTNYQAVMGFIDFEKAPFVKGIDLIDPIIDAIQKKDVIELAYHKFEEKQPETHFVHPYFMKEYRNRWYVIGLNEIKNGIRTYALDRVVSIKPVCRPYKENSIINSDDYFKNCIGLNLMQNQVHRIVLAFSGKGGNYLKTQYIHHSQKILIDSDNELVIELNLIINYELIGIILSFGESVKVLEPQLLADKILEIGKKVVGKYIQVS